MVDLLTDWQQHCSGEKTFDKSHFFKLFSPDLSPKDLQGIFQFFPRGQELTQRMIGLLKAGTMRNRQYLAPRAEHRATTAELASFIHDPVQN